MLTLEEAMEHRKNFYPEEDYTQEDICPPELSKEDKIEACKEAKEFGFKWFTYCPNCHESYFGAAGINLEKLKVDKCYVCNNDKLEVYEAKTYKRVI